jgi:hypothetical protein
MKTGRKILPGAVVYPSHLWFIHITFNVLERTQVMDTFMVTVSKVTTDHNKSGLSRTLIFC